MAAAPDEVRAWIDVAIRVSQGERADLLCPARQDGYLTIRWIPHPRGELSDSEVRCRRAGPRTAC